MSRAGKWTVSVLGALTAGTVVALGGVALTVTSTPPRSEYTAAVWNLAPLLAGVFAAAFILRLVRLAERDVTFKAPRAAWFAARFALVCFGVLVSAVLGLQWIATFSRDPDRAIGIAIGVSSVLGTCALLRWGRRRLARDAGA